MGTIWVLWLHVYEPYHSLDFYEAPPATQLIKIKWVIGEETEDGQPWLVAKAREGNYIAQKSCTVQYICQDIFQFRISF